MKTMCDIGEDGFENIEDVDIFQFVNLSLDEHNLNLKFIFFDVNENINN